VTLICILYAREKKSKKFSLYRRYGNDRHRLSPRKDGSAEKETRKKIPLFGKGLQTTDIDPHSTYIKKVQKSPKNWEM